MRHDDYSSIGFHQRECEENNVTYFLKKHIGLFPDRVALKWVPKDVICSCDRTEELYHESITYGELSNKVSCMAKGLREIGVNKGDRIIIYLPISLEMYLAIFAVQYIGAIPVFLDPWLTKEHIQICINTVKPKGVISCDGAEILKFNHIPSKIKMGKSSRNSSSDLIELTETKGVAEIEPVGPEATALITFTTGSSGAPKGANRTHQLLVRQHRALDKCIPYYEEDIDLPLFPIFALNSLAAGVNTVLPAIDLAIPSEKDAALLANQILFLKVTCSTLSPSIFVRLAEYGCENHLYLEVKS